MAPQWFDQDELGRGRVRDVVISGDDLDEARDMIQACPEDAVHLDERSQ
jgi:ferredoxin